MKPSTGEAGDQFKFIVILRANLTLWGRNQRSNGAARGMQAMPGGDGGGGFGWNKQQMNRIGRSYWQSLTIIKE